MSIKKRLNVAFIVILICGSLGALVGMGLINEAGSNYTACIENYGFTQGNVGQLAISINNLKSSAITAANTTDPNVRKNVLATFERSAAEIDTQLATLAGVMQNISFSVADAESDQLKQEVTDSFNSLNKQVVEFVNESTLMVNSSAGVRSEMQILSLNKNSDLVNSVADAYINTLIKAGERETGTLAMGIVFFMGVVACFIIIAIIVAIIVVKRITRLIVLPSTKMSAVAEELAAGNLNVDIAYRSKDEIGALALALDTAVDGWKTYVMEIDRILNAMSVGNFQVSTNVAFQGDFKKIESSIQTILQSMNSTLGQINVAAEEVTASSNLVSEGSQALSNGATEQASAIEELTMGIESISSHISSNSQTAFQARDKASMVGEEIEKSNKHMKNMIMSMEEITSTSNEIEKIIKAIDDIAFQTNILALNASVEAARAGVAGKGFAVVADEVRNLAGKSAEAAKDTATLIEKSIQAVNKGAIIANENEKMLASTMSLTKESVALIESIAEAFEEQNQSILEINQNVYQVSAVVQSTSATAEESAAASEELYGQASLLKELITKFQLKRLS